MQLNKKTLLSYTKCLFIHQVRLDRIKELIQVLHRLGTISILPVSGLASTYARSVWIGRFAIQKWNERFRFLQCLYTTSGRPYEFWYQCLGKSATMVEITTGKEGYLKHQGGRGDPDFTVTVTHPGFLAKSSHHLTLEPTPQRVWVEHLSGQRNKITNIYPMNWN